MASFAGINHDELFSNETLEIINEALKDLHSKGLERSKEYNCLLLLLNCWSKNTKSDTETLTIDSLNEKNFPLLTSDLCRVIKEQLSIYKDIVVTSKNESNKTDGTELNSTPFARKWKIPNEKVRSDLLASFRRMIYFSKTPGLQHNDLVRQRDNCIRDLMKERREYLLNIMGSLTDPEDLVNSKIECKALGLFSLQQKVRAKILTVMKDDQSNEHRFNPKNFRKNKKYQIRDLKSSVTYEKYLLEEKERDEKKNYERKMLALLQHIKEFKEFHRNSHQKISNLMKSIQMHFSSNDKQKRLEEEKMEKERMRILMTEDEEGYRKLLDEKKDKRLHLLLSQTDEYIRGLMELIKLQRQTIALAEPACIPITEKMDNSETLDLHSVSDQSTTFTEDKSQQSSEDASVSQISEKNIQYAMDDDLLLKKDDDQVDDLNSSKDRDGADSANNNDQTSVNNAVYYQMVHSVTEVIKEQPSILTGGKLKDYQIRGLEWMVSLHNNRLSGILADEMGLGKTIQTISLVCYLVEKKMVNGPFLIIVPLSTISNWQLEFEKWAPSLIVISYKGSQLNRRSLAQRVKNGRYHVLLTTFEYIMKDRSLLSKIGWWYLVVDEGHRMKNHDCKLNQTLSTWYQIPRRLLLTGTPLQNRLPELWSLLNFILPDIFHSCSTFEQWFNSPFANTNEKVDLNEEETFLVIRRLHKVLRPFLLRRLKKEVESQLPEKVEYVIKCRMSALQRHLYSRMRSTGHMITVKDSKSGASGIGSRQLMNILVQLRKICNHPFMFPHVEEAYASHLGHASQFISGPALFRACGKVELLDRILPKLKRCGHRCLIFCQMTQTMSILEDYLTWKGLAYLRLDGNTKSEDRAQLLSLFNSQGSPYFVFLLSTRAGGLGLNLQSADTVIIYDSDWNPQQDLQAQDRAHRIGQKNEVRVLRLATVNSVEENILMAAREKLILDEKVIQAGMFNQSSTNSQRKAFLEALLENDSIVDEQTNCDEVPDDETVNQMVCRSDEEFEIFQFMDQERKRLEARSYSLGEGWSDRLIQDDELPNWLLNLPLDSNEKLMDTDSENISQSSLINPSETIDDSTSATLSIIKEKRGLDESDPLDEAQWMEAMKNLHRNSTPAVIHTSDFKIRSIDSKNIDMSSESLTETEQSKSSFTSTRTKKGLPGRPKSASSKVIGSSRTRSTDTKAKRGEKLSQMKDLLKEIQKSENDNGRRVAEVFYQLPSQKVLPDYYQLISTPMDIRKIERNVRLGKYQNMQQLQEDFDLMIKNAQTYNMESSQIYHDSVSLKLIFDNLLKNICTGDQNSE